MKSENLNLPATQFISKESDDLSSFWKKSDSRIGRDLRSLVKYRIEKLAELGLVYAKGSKVPAAHSHVKVPT